MTVTMRGGLRLSFFFLCMAISCNNQRKAELDRAKSLDMQALRYRDQGRYDEAEALLKQALAIRESALGPNHPDLSGRLSVLAEFYRTQGKYGEAEPLYKRALDISEKALGPD